MDISKRGTQGPMKRLPRGEVSAWARGAWGQGELGVVHLLISRQLTEHFCHVLGSSLHGTAAVAAEAETGLSYWGRENQHVSNSYQTNHRIMTGINQRLSSDPGPGEGGEWQRVCEHSQEQPTCPFTAGTPSP